MTPTDRGRPSRSRRALELDLERGASSRGAWSDLAALVTRRGESAGWQRVFARGERRIFDLASITKPIVATLALRLERQEGLAVDTPIGQIFGSRQRVCAELRGVRIVDLLRHRARLQAWVPLYARCTSPEEARDRVLAGEWLGARRGTYSDLSALVLGWTLEMAMGEALERLLARHVTGPLGLEGPNYGTVDRPVAGAVRCEIGTGMEIRLARASGLEIDDLGPPPAGVPQDGNARFLGPTGHAGLFGTAEQIERLGREWLRPGALLESRQVDRCWRSLGTFAAGWRRRTLRGAAGPALSPEARGHTGFTGGQLWLDPARRLVLVQLGHRRSPFSDLGAARRRFHRLAVALADPAGEAGPVV